MAVVTMRQLLESGVHFGHQTRRWNPKMKRFILTERNSIYIIDLQQSLAYIDAGYEFVKSTVARGGTVLFVGTKRQAQEPIEEQANRVGMPFVNQRWLGGMLTNFQTMHQRLQRMKELDEVDFDDVAGSNRTKKELLQMRREHAKLTRTLGGIREMGRTPAAVWIVDTKKEHLAVDEARKLGIPIVAILDTNCDPDDVDYPIPGNDDAIRSVGLLTRVIADAVAEGLIARGGSKTGEEDAGTELGADEPMADWERELLEKKDAEDKAAAAAAPAPSATPEAAPATLADAPAAEPVDAAPAADAAASPATTSGAGTTPPEGATATAPFGPGSKAPLKSGNAPKGHPIKGNADSGKYHAEDGQWYEQTVAEVWFDTAESAEAAGFTRAGA
ncbi:30S ribosomal protein S2 [Aeromicrobium sp. CF3.5]|uniref:30S ribosomal protein S2 n=1 Tax=Aeromicrobium sp. CF3.5 TaxID=3373078 RepID=UPI003EE4AD48